MASKYHAKPTFVDGIRFASKKEAARYSELKLLERAKAISGITLQPRYTLVVNGEKVCTYVADFSYLDEQTRKLVVEDTKGFKTPDYIIKRKLLLALHPSLDHREL